MIEQNYGPPYINLKATSQISRRTPKSRPRLPLLESMNICGWNCGPQLVGLCMGRRPAPSHIPNTHIDIMRLAKPSRSGRSGLNYLSRNPSQTSRLGDIGYVDEKGTWRR